MDVFVSRLGLRNRKGYKLLDEESQLPATPAAVKAMPGRGTGTEPAPRRVTFADIPQPVLGTARLPKAPAAPLASVEPVATPETSILLETSILADRVDAGIIRLKDFQRAVGNLKVSPVTAYCDDRTARNFLADALNETGVAALALDGSAPVALEDQINAVRAAIGRFCCHPQPLMVDLASELEAAVARLAGLLEDHAASRRAGILTDDHPLQAAAAPEDVTLLARQVGSLDACLKSLEKLSHQIEDFSMSKLSLYCQDPVIRGKISLRLREALDRIQCEPLQDDPAFGRLVEAAFARIATITCRGADALAATCRNAEDGLADLKTMIEQQKTALVVKTGL